MIYINKYCIFVKCNCDKYYLIVNKIKKSKNMKQFYNTRICKYLIYSAMYYVMYKIFGFELTVIIALANVAGELDYNCTNRKF